MAHPKRFELLTPRFVVWCSIQLSYGCAWPLSASLLRCGVLLNGPFHECKRIIEKKWSHLEEVQFLKVSSRSAATTTAKVETGNAMMLKHH